jgi:anti-anti-sigma regulatory factor
MAMTGDPRARHTDVEGIFEVTTIVRWLATDVVRVVVAGDLDVVAVDAFGRALVLATRHRPTRLEVDLSAVTFCSCAAIDQVIRLRPATPGLVVIGAAPPVRRLFALAAAADLLDPC